MQEFNPIIKQQQQDNAILIIFFIKIVPILKSFVELYYVYYIFTTKVAYFYIRKIFYFIYYKIKGLSIIINNKSFGTTNVTITTYI